MSRTLEESAKELEQAKQNFIKVCQNQVPVLHGVIKAMNKAFSDVKLKPKEKVMQYKQNDRIERKMSKNNWFRGDFISYYKPKEPCKEELVCIMLDGSSSPTICSVDVIRPMRLICDEARERLKEFYANNIEFICFCNSKEQMAELFSKEPNPDFDIDKALSDGLHYLCCNNDNGFQILSISTKKEMQELNLSTGEVIYHDEKDKVSVKMFELEEKIKELNKEIQMRDGFIVARDNLLKEKRAEIERLESIIQGQNMVINKVNEMTSK